jgi:ABC-2 type transport system permease protein
MSTEAIAEATGRPAPLVLPRRTMGHEFRGVRIVWQRELIRFLQDRPRIVVGLVQPVLFLFVLGTGLSRLAAGSTGGLNLRTFMFPGVVAMSTMFTALFSAASIVWDREFGFLREMLVAPISRASIVIGKCLGGATVATMQGLVILALAGTVGVPYAPTLIATLVLELLVLSFTLTSLGVLLAARIKQIQSFFALMQLLVLPMFFLSGALYPLRNLPTWLHVLTLIDPLTYAVDPMRQAVFAHLHASPVAAAALNPGITWGSWRVPVMLEVAIVLALGVAMLGVAIVQFRRAE